VVTEWTQRLDANPDFREKFARKADKGAIVIAMQTCPRDGLMLFLSQSDEQCGLVIIADAVGERLD